MAQGGPKLKKRGGADRLRKTQKQKQLKKGRREIKPRKKKAVQAIVTNRKLTKGISKCVEMEMKERASSLGQGFKILPALDNTHEDQSKKHSK